MDNRFTKKRIANMLSYDWIKMVVFVAIITFVWVLIFTVGSPSISTGQTFGVFYYYGNGAFNYKHSPTEYARIIDQTGAFSYDVLDFDVREITTEYFETILMLSESTQEGDVMITVDRADSVEKFNSEFRSFIDKSGESVYDYDDLIADAKTYCISNGLVYCDSNGEYFLNEENIKTLFANRMSKDPRFRNKAGEKYLNGVQSEIQRIKQLWNNAVALENCLATYPQLRYDYARYTQLIASNPEQYSKEPYLNHESKTYGINLGALVGNEDYSVTNEFFYPIKNENGEITGFSSEGIVLCVYNYKEYQPHLQFESIGFVNGVISRYSNFLTFDCKDIIK